jgi:hypothetical protein
MTTQWAALGVVALVIGALLYAFLRGGIAIKPDPEHKDPSDPGGHSLV